MFNLFERSTSSFFLEDKEARKSFKVKDLLCSSLVRKLYVMKEEKPSSDVAMEMSNSRVNCDTSRVGPEDFNGYGSGNELSSSREQGKNEHNEGGGEKAVINSGLIGSPEEQVSKAKFESMEGELSQIKEEFNKVFTEKSQLEKSVRELQDSHNKEENALRAQISKLQQEKLQLQDAIGQYQANEQTHKHEFDQVLYRAHEMLERETQEKMVSIAEQKSLRQQVENLSKNMKSLQVKSEEYARFHCDQEDQIDDFKRLKKMIHENGLPSIEQVVALLRQNETYREEFLSERKEKERVLSLKDKLKRDLENAQSRISSLQEQVYKYREHIYFLQQRFKQDGGSPIPSSMLEIQPPLHGNNLSRLYGNTAPQYINEMILQGNSQAKFAAGALPEGKKAGTGKHGDGTGKPWQYQQGTYGRYGRQMSAEDWKRGQNHGQQWDNFYGSNQSSGRLSSASSLSSVRSTSSSSEEVPVDGQLDSRPGFGIGGLGSRRQGQRPAGLPDKPLDDSARGFQNYGPPSSPFEAWSPKPQGFSMRGQRRYSSPSGNGMRSPTTDFWPSQQSMGGFQRSWQSASEQAPYPDPTQVSMSSGLRPTADPWPPAATAVSSNSNSQATLATSGQGDTMTFMAGGIGMR